ncbi:MAG TPA: hypothetical protein VKZ63_08575 [Kofleriaceae bacterium]|nr:hypothetical protein [Kofleriaceae bacterium]
MKNVKTTLRARLLAAVAAFGFTAIGGATAASAHEGHATGAKVQVRHTVPASANASARASVATGYWQRSANGYVWRETRPRIERNHYKVTRVRPGVDRYDIDRDGRLDHFEIDYRRFDTDRDGVLSHGERYPYWKHMAEMGIFGRLNSDEIERVALLGYVFDKDKDGRMMGAELRAVELLIDSLRMFDRTDRDGDRYVTSAELRRGGNTAGILAIGPMDKNGDRKLTKNEVRDAVVAAYREGRV